MEYKKLFHTVENRDNVDYIESNGPFLSDKNTWLGEGYYFWDTYIQLAKWWGKVHYHNDYIICKTSCTVDNSLVYDLHHDLEAIDEFYEYSEILKEVYPNKSITVCFVLNHMRKNMKGFNYKVIRACGQNSVKSDSSILSRKMNFTDNNNAFLSMMPEVQICFTDKGLLAGNKFEVVYPDEFRRDYTV